MTRGTKRTEEDSAELSEEELGKTRGGGVLAIPIGSVRSPKKIASRDDGQTIADGVVDP